MHTTFKRLFIVLSILATAVHAEYTLTPGKRSRSRIDTLPCKSVADMKRVPQDAGYYAKQFVPMARKEQLKLDREYNRHYFSPWKLSKMDEPKEDVTWQFRFLDRKKIYIDTERVLSEKAKKKWVKNSNFDKYNAVHRKGITIRHSNLRAFPTETPMYYDPWKTTEGFPFDYNQNSEIHLNTPLYISHYSHNRRWAFVKAAHAYGWVKRADIALASRRFMKQFQVGRYGITVRDDLLLRNKKKKVCLIKLGTIFPYAQGRRSLLVAKKNIQGYATLAKLKQPSTTLLAPKPLHYTAENVAKIAREFYNEPYGWGGKLLTRDCSATTRDFFGCFGIFMGRNSSRQAKSGTQINIKGMPKAAKRAAIIKHAKPFRSMLYVPGHIGIYLGHYRNEPIIMHTYWGVRLKDFSKYVLSRTIITTLEPGKELTQLRKKSKLINTLQTIINF